MHALALRQLGRFHRHHLRATGALHSSALPAVAPHTAASAGRDSLRPAWPLQHLRFKSNKRKGSARTPQEEEEPEQDPEDSDHEDVGEDPNLPKDYKDIQKSVQSFRYDVIMKAGLDMARK